MPYTREEHSVYKVIDAKEKYAVVQNDRDKYLVYEEGLDVGDLVFVEQGAKEIQTMSYFNRYNFKQYLRSKNITHQYDEKQIQEVVKKDGMLNKLYEKAKKKDQQLYQVLSRKSVDEQTTYRISISFVFYKLRKIMKDRRFSLLFIGLVLQLISPVGISMTLFLCSLSLELFLPNISKMNRFGLAAAVCICLSPTSIFTLSFILPLSLHMVSLIYKLKNIHRYTLMIFIFILFQGECDILSLIVYPLIHFIQFTLWILALLSTYINACYPLFQGLLKLYIFISKFKIPIYYAPSILLSSITVVKLYQILEGNKAAYRYIQILMCVFVFPYMNPVASVEYINVGQGDSTLIVGPFQSYVILIDAAGNKNKDIAKEILIPRLKQLGIRKIDSLVITHDDFDHSGSRNALVENFKVEQVIEKVPSVLPTNQFQFVEGLGTYEDENNNSLVMVGEQYGLRFFFGGDSGEVKENIFVQNYDYPIDILKLSHHGSATSSSEMFVHELNPILGIASSGQNNFYGHPSKEVVERLEKNEIKMFNTADDGSIRITSLFIFHIVRTSEGEFGIIVKR